MKIIKTFLMLTLAIAASYAHQSHAMFTAWVIKKNVQPYLAQASHGKPSFFSPKTLATRFVTMTVVGVLWDGAVCSNGERAQFERNNILKNWFKYDPAEFKVSQARDIPSLVQNVDSVYKFLKHCVKFNIEKIVDTGKLIYEAFSTDAFKYTQIAKDFNALSGQVATVGANPNKKEEEPQK